MDQFGFCLFIIQIILHIAFLKARPQGHNYHDVGEAFMHVGHARWESVPPQRQNEYRHISSDRSPSQTQTPSGCLNSRNFIKSPSLSHCNSNPLLRPISTGRSLVPRLPLSWGFDPPQTLVVRFSECLDVTPPRHLSLSLSRSYEEAFDRLTPSALFHCLAID